MKRTSLLVPATLSLGLVAHAGARAATYFVSASVGNDANAGTTPAAPWQSLSRVNRALLSTGDRVFLRAGDEWDDETLSIGWNGTPAQHARVGAYRETADGSIVFGTAPGVPRPVIDDHYRRHGATFTTANSAVAGVAVSGSHVDVEDLEIKRAGWGVSVRGASQADVTLSNLFVNGAFQCGIEAENVSSLTIRGSELFNAEAFKGLFHLPGNWCSTIGIQRSHGVLVEGNFVHESWGEGINIFYGSSDAVVRHNVLYANQAVGIYVGALNGAVIHGNLILGTADRAFWRTGSSTGPGIAMDNESYEFVGGATTSRGAPTGRGSLCPLGAYGNYTGHGVSLCPQALQNIAIYDNLVAGTSAGLGVWYADYPADYTHVSVVNNTFVDNDQQLYLGGQSAADFEVRNNLFMSLTPGSADVVGSNSGMTFATNYWSLGEPKGIGGAPVRSATDVVGGAELARMGGWRSLRSANEVDATSFVPTAASSTLGRGDGRGLSFDVDYFGTALHAPPDLGAVAGAVPPAPAAAGGGNTVTPGVVQAGQPIRIAGTLTTTTSANPGTVFFWLAGPDGRCVARTSVGASLQAGMPTTVAASLLVPGASPAGRYVISAGAYRGATALQPYVADFAEVTVR